MLMYTGVQTFKCAQKRFNDERAMWKEFFDSISVNFCGNRYVELKLLIKEMDKKLAHIEEPVRTKLYYLFDYEGEAIITEKQFNHLMKIWSAFSANDINNDNELDANEVKTLFWLFDGKKPTQEKIIRETLIMDEDKSGTIDRLEWLAYLCSAGGGKGKDYYDFELRELFEMSDKSKSGSLTMTELVQFLKYDMKQSYQKLDDANKWKVDDKFKQIAQEVFTILMQRRPKGKTDSMNWVEMKNYRTACKERIDALENHIENLVLEEKRLSSLQSNMSKISKGLMGKYNLTTATTTSTPQPDPPIALKKVLQGLDNGADLNTSI